MEVKFMVVTMMVASIYLGMLYLSKLWRTHYITCLIIAFVIGFPLVFIHGMGFDQYGVVEKVAFGCILGVLLVQLSHISITHIFEKV